MVSSCSTFSDSLEDSCGTVFAHQAPNAAPSLNSRISNQRRKTSCSISVTSGSQPLPAPASGSSPTRCTAKPDICISAAVRTSTASTVSPCSFKLAARSSETSSPRQALGAYFQRTWSSDKTSNKRGSYHLCMGPIDPSPRHGPNRVSAWRTRTTSPQRTSKPSSTLP